MVLLSIVTVTYNSREEIKTMLESLSDTIDFHQLDAETLVWDNNSRDGTSIVARHAIDAYPHLNLRVFQSWSNMGLSKALNRMIPEAKGDLILFCNPDVRFDRSLNNLLKYVRERPMVGAVPEFYNPDGTLQRVINRRIATVARITMDFTAFGRLWLSKLWPWIRRDYAYMDRKFHGPERIEQPGGSCLLMSRQAVQMLTPFYDEHFPVLWNDVDMAKRAEQLGIQFVLVPSARIVHGLAHSTKTIRNPAFITMLFYSDAGMIGFARKWDLNPRIPKERDVSSH